MVVRLGGRMESRGVLGRPVCEAALEKALWNLIQTSYPTQMN